MVFKFKKKKFQGDKKIKQMAKGFITKSVKSLGIKIDKNLNQQHVNAVPVEISRANSFYYKVKMIYYF